MLAAVLGVFLCLVVRAIVALLVANLLRLVLGVVITVLVRVLSSVAMRPVVGANGLVRVRLFVVLADLLVLVPCLALLVLDGVLVVVALVLVARLRYLDLLVVVAALVFLLTANLILHHAFLVVVCVNGFFRD